MGEKGMDAGGLSDQTAVAPAEPSNLEAMGAPIEGGGQDQPPPQSSGPDVGEVIGDVLDPLGIHKLFG